MDMERFWDKKTIVSFILALFIAAIHNDTIAAFSTMGGDPSLLFIARAFDALSSLTLTRVAVPLFFILSGVCFFRDHERMLYAKKIKSRIRTLLIPYLFWNGTLMAILILLSHTPYRGLVSLSAPIVPTWRMIVEGLIWFRSNNPFWFLYALILLTVSTPLIGLLMQKRWTGYAACALALIVPAIFPGPFTVVFQGRFYPSIFFYVVGCFLGRYHFAFFSQRFGKRQRIVSACICALFVVLKMAELYAVIRIHAVILDILSLAAALAFWILCDLFVEKIEIRPYMRDSFMLYALHPVIGTVLTNLTVSCWGERTAAAIPAAISVYALTISLSLFLAGALRQHVPRLYRVISGNRGVR